MSMRRAEPPHGPRVASVSASFGLVRLGRTASQCVSHTLDDHETSARAAPATDVEDTFTRKRSEQFDKVPCDWLDERNATLVVHRSELVEHASDLFDGFVVVAGSRSRTAVRNPRTEQGSETDALRSGTWSGT
jgi:hypothetical protein